MKEKTLIEQVQEVFKKERIDRLNEEHIDILRNYISETYEDWASIKNWDAQIEHGWFTREGIVSKSDDRSVKIQALRMFIGFEVEEIAAIFNITRVTYTKFEGKGFEKGISENSRKNLIEKSEEKLYLKNENPKYAELWNILLPNKENIDIDEDIKVQKCGLDHYFTSYYSICPYCDVLDLEISEYEDVESETFESVNNEFEKWLKQYLEENNLASKVETPGEIFKRRKSQFTLEINEFNFDPVIFKNPPEDTEVIKEMLKRIGNEIEEKNKELFLLILKAQSLLHSKYKTALTSEIFHMYMKNPNKHRATVDEILKDKNFPGSSKELDIKNEEILKYLATISFYQNQDW